MLTLSSVLLLMGKRIPPQKHAIFVFYHYLFAFNIPTDHIQVSAGVLINLCLKKALFK